MISVCFDKQNHGIYRRDKISFAYKFALVVYVCNLSASFANPLTKGVNLRSLTPVVALYGSNAGSKFVELGFKQDIQSAWSKLAGDSRSPLIGVFEKLDFAIAPISDARKPMINEPSTDTSDQGENKAKHWFDCNTCYPLLTFLTAFLIGAGAYAHGRRSIKTVIKRQQHPIYWRRITPPTPAKPKSVDMLLEMSNSSQFMTLRADGSVKLKCGTEISAESVGSFIKVREEVMAK